MTKAELIKKEKTKFNKILKELDSDKKKSLETAVENAAWMAVSLAELRSIIDRDGYVETYQNGENQSGTKDSVAVRTFNNMIKNYNATVKMILDQLSPGDSQKAGDELAKFLMKK